MEASDYTNPEEYPTEIHDYLATFEQCLGSVEEMLKAMMLVSRSDLQKVSNVAFDNLFVTNARISGNPN